MMIISSPLKETLSECSVCRKWLGSRKSCSAAEWGLEKFDKSFWDAMASSAQRQFNNRKKENEQSPSATC